MKYGIQITQMKQIFTDRLKKTVCISLNQCHQRAYKLTNQQITK